MPDWIIVLIVLMILGIVLDGLRRMRLRRRENIRLSRRAELADKEVSELGGSLREEHASEFPSGGARKSRQAQLDEQKESANTLTFDEPVPMLMESVIDEDGTDELNQVESHNSNTDQQSDVSDKHASAKASLGILADDLDLDAPEYNDFDGNLGDEPKLGSLDNLDALEPAPHNTPSKKTVSHSDKPSDQPNKHNPLSFKHYKSKSTEQKVVQDKPKNEPQEVIIINVMAKNGALFDGKQLLQAFVDNHFKFGERDIFHRHVHADGNGTVLFSIANMVVPGTFDLVKIDEFVTPGVSIFMTLPVDEESLIAFNIMIAAAKNLAQTLEGELKDENRSVMTAQTIEHAKEKVLEYERKRKLHNR